MADLLIDSDILIAVGRQSQEAIDYLQRRGTQYTLVVSSIAHMEFLAGCRNKTEQRQTERFLRQVPLGR